MWLIQTERLDTFSVLFAVWQTVCFPALNKQHSSFLLTTITRGFACLTEIIAAIVSKTSWLIKKFIPALPSPESNFTSGHKGLDSSWHPCQTSFYFLHDRGTKGVHCSSDLHGSIILCCFALVWDKKKKVVFHSFCQLDVSFWHVAEMGYSKLKKLSSESSSLKVNMWKKWTKEKIPVCVTEAGHGDLRIHTRTGNGTFPGGGLSACHLLPSTSGWEGSVSILTLLVSMTLYLHRSLITLQTLLHLAS